MLTKDITLTHLHVSVCNILLILCSYFLLKSQIVDSEAVLLASTQQSMLRQQNCILDVRGLSQKVVDFLNSKKS